MKNALVMLVKYYRRILFFLAASVLFSGCSVAQNNIQENNYAQNTPNYDLAMSIINHVAKCWAVPRSAIESSNVVHINIALNRNTSLKKVEVAKIDRERYKSEPEFRNLADSAISKKMFSYGIPIRG